MEYSNLIQQLFKTEYRKIIAVLCRLFGSRHIAVVEDIVSTVFLEASEKWASEGPPANPTSWLYAVARNKTIDYLRRNQIFLVNVSEHLRGQVTHCHEIDLNFSDENIVDSELAMLFAICHPCNTKEARVGLALKLLCGFSVEQIANAFLTNKEVVYKRLQRAKDKLRAKEIEIQSPTKQEITDRMDSVLLILYLLFSEGYFGSDRDIVIRRELCTEAMRLTFLMTNTSETNSPEVNALLSLMCFHASRFEARIDQQGDRILYDEQNTGLWDADLIDKGEYFLNMAARGDRVTKFHLEAAIAYWHTKREEPGCDKWQNVLMLYDQLLACNNSPMAALSRAFAVSKVHGKLRAIADAEKINMPHNYFYHCLLAELYNGVNIEKEVFHLRRALVLTPLAGDRLMIDRKLQRAITQQGQNLG
ncbi:MAG TPA: sigma-70 family RNA polymerase sigma factor [Chryseosolibacter sp.]